MKAKRKFPEFQKDKSVRSQDMQKAKMWESVYNMCNSLLASLREKFP